jgi:sugar/nucleoside kinase (ribokinase family)
MSEHLDIICMGTALVDSIIKGFDPEPVSASGFTAASGSLNVGGEAVNEAVTAARLGACTGIFCFLGDDPAGDMICSYLQKNHVDASWILREKDHPTPVTTMFVNEDGTRKSITNSSHCYNFHPEKHPEAFSGAKIIILGSLFRAPFNDPNIIHDVCARASEAGTMIFADTKLPNFVKLGLDDISDTLPLIDFITPNEDEAKYYTGKEDPEEMADVFLSYGVKNVLIKLGAKGCFFKNAQMSIALPAFPIDAVDATGAGDSFVAGLASEILRMREAAGEGGAGNASVAADGAENSGAGAGGEEEAAGQVLLEKNKMEQALRFASACGAICTTAVGAGTALQSREQVLAFLQKMD